MAELPDIFKAKEHDSMGFTVIPDVDGDGNKIQYSVRIIKSELKKNKSSEGKNMAIQFRIVEGKYEGRLLFTRLNLVNKNHLAVTIAQNELADICRACGKEAVKDSEDLHDIDFYVEVKVTEETDTNPAGNQITKYINKVGVVKEKPSVFSR